MRTTGRMTLFVLLFALAAGVAASSGQASSRVQYGIQDDAWLEFGPGTLDQRLRRSSGSACRSSASRCAGTEIAPRRPKDADLAARSRVRLASARTGSSAAFAATG